jgi:hypothetical protein
LFNQYTIFGELKKEYEKFDSYKKAPARNQLEVELLKKDFDYLKKETKITS